MKGWFSHRLHHVPMYKIWKVFRQLKWPSWSLKVTHFAPVQCEVLWSASLHVCLQAYLKNRIPNFTKFCVHVITAWIWGFWCCYICLFSVHCDKLLVTIVNNNLLGGELTVSAVVDLLLGLRGHLLRIWHLLENARKRSDKPLLIRSSSSSLLAFCWCLCLILLHSVLIYHSVRSAVTEWVICQSWGCIHIDWSLVWVGYISLYVAALVKRPILWKH